MYEVTGQQAFQDLLGAITLSDVLVFLLDGSFLFSVYRKINKFFTEKTTEDIAKTKKEEQRDKDIKTAIDAINALPGYRKQSLEIQKQLSDSIESLNKRIDENNKRLNKMEEDERRRERNKMRDRLLQSYRFYTNPEHNPNRSWNRMEAESFWEMFKDYEDAGGDGYMHTIVQPAMNLLTIIEMDE